MKNRQGIGRHPHQASISPQILRIWIWGKIQRRFRSETENITPFLIRNRLSKSSTKITLPTSPIWVTNYIIKLYNTNSIISVTNCFEMLYSSYFTILGGICIYSCNTMFSELSLMFVAWKQSVGIEKGLYLHIMRERSYHDARSGAKIGIRRAETASYIIPPIESSFVHDQTFTRSSYANTP